MFWFMYMLYYDVSLYNEKMNITYTTNEGSIVVRPLVFAITILYDFELMNVPSISILPYLFDNATSE
jgi:hypothetical protein